MNTLRQPLPRRVACLLMILLLLFQSARAVAPGPAWWTQHGVLDPDGARDDFAAANIGQLKYLATQADAALDEAEAVSPVPLSSAQAQAKSAIDAMIAEWSALPLPGVPRDDFLALNAGQLKHVAALFYDRLGLPPPWAGAAPLGDDFRMVNVGQLKQAFSFELRLARGGPPVQIPASWWDTAHAAWAALDSTQRAAGSTVEDFNGNGLSNLEEYLMHPARLLFDPDDKDGDRIPDVAEAASGGILSPLLFADAVEDHDNDGVMNYEEVLLGLNLNGPVTTGRADSLTDAEVLAWGLLAGVPLAPGTDAVRACWEAIDEAWIEQQGGMEFYGHWLDRTPASGVPAGWTAFQAEFWGPTSPDAASIQYPPTPIDLDGDDIPDMDRDGDGLPDLWEYRHELDLRGAEDAWDDPDGDTLVNLMEFANGTNPRLADTDGDGFSDAEEGQHGGDPRQGGSVPPVLVQIIGESAHTHYPGQTTPALAVRATQAGIARMGFEITFTLTAGNGVLSPATQAGGGSAASLTLSTGADGIAAVTYTAAAQAEQAQVQAAAAGMAGTHVFTVHVIPMPPIFAGWGAGGGTTGSATAPPSAAAATAAVAAASDGMLIRVRRKYESDESFPGRDFKNSPSEFLGPNGMDPASSGGLNIPFDNPNLAHHTELTLQWASAGPARSRTYLVLVFKGRDAYARWAIIDGVRVGVPDMVGSVTFAVDQHGMLAVTTSGNLSGYMEKAAGEASVAFTHEPPTSEDERFVISLLPVDLDIVHPATGELNEGKQHDQTQGGLVAVKRGDFTKPVRDEPVTELVIRANTAIQGLKWKLKFSGGTNFKLWKDLARTQAVVSEQTEFDPAQDVKLYFEGLKKSGSVGEHNVKLMAVINGSSVEADTVYFTVVEAQVLVQVRYWIREGWIDIPWHPLVNPVPNYAIAGGDRRDNSLEWEPGKGTPPLTTAPGYRVAQEIVIQPFKELNPTGLTPGSRTGSAENRSGITSLFHKPSSVPLWALPWAPGVNELLPTATPTGAVPPPTDRMHIESSRDGDRKGKVRFHGAASDPLVPGAFDIDWDLNIIIDAADPLQLKYEIEGFHDDYPAVEVNMKFDAKDPSPTTTPFTTSPQPYFWLHPLPSVPFALGNGAQIDISPAKKGDVK